MANDGETVRDVCAEMRKELNQSWWDVDRKKVHDIPDRILAAYEREIAAKDEMSRIAVQSAQARFDEEIAAKDAEIARLKAVLKPVMECATKCPKGSMPKGFSRKEK